MEHPFINNLNDLTTDQLLEKINELNRKLMISIKSGNPHLSQQVQMAIDSYRSKYDEKVKEQWNARSGSNKDYGGKIDIS